MKAFAAFLLVLCCPVLCNAVAWRCEEGPRLYRAKQIDAGHGAVVALDIYGRTFFLAKTRWAYLGSYRFKHLTVGEAGLWGSDNTNKVNKYVAGSFKPATGLLMQQVDAGDHHLVGVQAKYSRGYCAYPNTVRYYRGLGSMYWRYVRASLKHISCGGGRCWAIDTNSRVLFAKKVASSCRLTGWTIVPGLLAKTVEVGSDGRVFALTKSGYIYERYSISSRYPQGRGWANRSVCMAAITMSYDLGYLWAATSSGLIFKCRV